VVDAAGLRPLPPSFYARPTLEAARALLGQHLCYVPAGETLLRVGRIVEVEAYLGPEDRASHARLVRRGGGLIPSPRSSLMFGPVGRAYVYLIYGMHHCFNVVAHPDEQVGAVLVRALQPVAGPEAGALAALAAQSLRGPARLCAALGLSRAHNGHDVTTREPGPHGALFVAAGAPLPDADVAAGPRIGVDYAGEDALLPYRLFERDSPFVSR
jgi:DNA-3-methyladenine glycosylase